MIYGNALQSGLFGLIIGFIGMGSGGILAYLIGNVMSKIIPLIISFSVGVIFSLIIFDIFPESIELGGVYIALIGILIGFLCAQKMDRFSHRVIIITHNPRRDYYVRSGLILTFAIAMHNFPTGVALGASLLDNYSIAWNLGLMMILHSIPEGLTVALPFVLGGISPLAILPTTSIVAIPTGIGAYIGYLFGMVVPWALSLLISIAIGTVLYVAFFEILLPSIRKISIFKGLISLLLGLIFGSIFLFFI